MLQLKDEAAFKAKLTSNPYWEGRWEYLSVIADKLKEWNVESLLEVGCRDFPLSDSSVTMDIKDEWKPTVLHDARETPWPFRTKQFDVCVSTQVWEHLGPKQLEAFLEAKRVAKHVVLSFPLNWTVGDEMHYGITMEKLAEWTAGNPPDSIVDIKNENGLIRSIWFWKFKEERMKPKVSVVIPCFNYGKWLTESIESVMGQTYCDFELIMVDYGSSDETPAIMDKYRQYGIMMTIPNKGQGNARNRGIAASEADYIVCLDADDKLMPEYLEKCIAVMEKDVVVATSTLYFGEREETHTPTTVEKRHFLCANQIMSYSMFPKEMWRKAGGYDERMTNLEDWDLWIRMMLEGCRVKVVGEVLAMVRAHEFNMNKSGDVGGWKNYMEGKYGGKLGFDEGLYLEMNHDVRAAVEKKIHRSGWSHYLTWGYNEKRPGVALGQEEYVRELRATLGLKR